MSCLLGDQGLLAPCGLSPPCVLPGSSTQPPSLGTPHLAHLTDVPCPQDTQHNLLKGPGWLQVPDRCPAGSAGPQRPALCSNREGRNHRESKEGLGEHLNPASSALEPHTGFSPPASASPCSSSATDATAQRLAAQHIPAVVGGESRQCPTAAARRWWHSAASRPTPPTSARGRLIPTVSLSPREHEGRCLRNNMNLSGTGAWEGCGCGLRYGHAP
nr:uncharacterized protein LOC129483526 [Symphalangus syndactylus]